MWLQVLVAVAAVSRARAERRTRRRGLCPRHASDGAAGACFRVSCRAPGWRTFSPSQTEAPRSGPQPRVSDGARQVTLRQDGRSGLKRNGLRFRPHVDSVPGSWHTRGPRTTAQPPVPVATAPGRRGGSRGRVPLQPLLSTAPGGFQKQRTRQTRPLCAQGSPRTASRPHGCRLHGAPGGARRGVATGSPRSWSSWLAAALLVQCGPGIAGRVPVCTAPVADTHVTHDGS